jgi:O-antigen biosynthesis protein
MQPSRAVLVLGMHRSGTSALARGLQMLGIYLGNDFIRAKPDNPTGYWEDRKIYEINERLLATFGLKWEDVALIDHARWHEPEVEALRTEAVEYLRSAFVGHQLWGFKDPRTIRLLPFWRSVLQLLGVEESYLLVIRNPRSVANSLMRRHGMDAVTAHLLWLVYVVPNLSTIAGQPFVVADYDMVMALPRQQLERIARGLKVPLTDSSETGIDQFANNFLDPNLRHSYFNASDFELDLNLPPLTREAYLWLRALATDRTSTDAPQFWTAWESSCKAVQRLISALSVHDRSNVQRRE